MLMTHRALAAAASLAGAGIDAEVIDMRCLAPLDMDAVKTSAAKTSRVLIVEEDNLTAGWGAEVAARLAADSFYDLDAPITRLAAPDTPLPCAAALEAAYVPSTAKIVTAATRLVGLLA
jgi:pyruvate/2-oxoglutarate/acetoin dehydrogenase E1 component